MAGGDLHELSATAQAQALRAGAASAVELVTAHLRRVESLGERFGAFVTVTAHSALEQAAAADARRHAARRAGTESELPVLLGVPTAIKDLAATAGVRTTFGSAAYADFVPDADAEIVARIRDAGMISLGKTNTPEFGCPCYTEPAVAPPARTPWDPTRSAGGSSGGAGAAVAARLLPIAHASDGGGSIRIPASVCGLVGMKPSRGRTGRLRIARSLRPVLVDAPVDPAVAQSFDDVSGLLESLGHEVVDVTLALPAGGPEQFQVLWGVAAALTPVPAGSEELLRPLTRWLRSLAAAADAMTVARAQVALRGAAAGVLRSLAGFDVVLTPTLAGLPAAVGGLRNDEDPAADYAAQASWTPYTSLWNITGNPAISLPLSWHTTADGTVLPIGAMLAGRPAGEEQLYSLAAQLEQARPWADRVPASVAA